MMRMAEFALRTQPCQAAAVEMTPVRKRTILLFYLQPAADRRLAYILPMSPMPMMPTMKLSMSPGTSGALDESVAASMLRTDSRSRKRVVVLSRGSCVRAMIKLLGN